MKSSVFKSEIKLDAASPVPLHHQLSEWIARDLRQNRAAAGTVIPSILTLASELKLNRDTVRKAYAVLEENGVIERSPGGRILKVSGEFVRRNAERALCSIGIVLPESMESLLEQTSRTALKTVSGIMDCAAEHGIASLIVPLPSADDEAERLSGWLREMLSRLNGLIYLGEDKDRSHGKAFEILLAEQRIPQVFISGCRFRDHLGIVHMDMQQGFRALTDHLVRLGHRRFAVCGPKIPVRKIFQLQTFDRIPLVLQCLFRQVPANTVAVQENVSTELETATRIRTLLRRKDRPTAVICTDDTTAELVIRQASELGLRIPEDLSVSGYGDTGEVPGLTSLAHPWRESGFAAVEMLAEYWRRSLPVNQLDRTLAVPLKIGKTTGKAPMGKR